ncbi:MAG: tRNA (N(6)-L-threonylcarbamoyladenosine(37)-C(2))-methylthiotransferase MtaB [Desulfobacterales bacterium]|nr:tRNA (N(6)-L-threonylcarbamoyladenosine(37)-C(2))-methylthiotransferase MtaB [Desulfobacterales bacterium]
MPKFITATLGCKVNQCESESIAKSLVSSGWTHAGDETVAGLCIINTCTVTRRASMQSRQAIRQAIRSNPGAVIIVTGCYAQTEPDELRKIEGINRIIENKEKEKIFEIITNETAHSFSFSPGSGCPADSGGFVHAPAARSRSRTRAFLKIQDGCDAFCTYCIVPYARGRSRSISVESVIESINNLRKAGYREVVLSGIHLGKYGQDLSPETTLTALLELINDSCVIDRVRLSSIEPNELTPGIIKLAAESGKICRHFHVPLQSGDDGILKKMHRPYSREYFKDLIIRIKESIPDVAIGVDILAGFPGETDEAFRNTYSLIEELPVSYLHVFPFSPRKKTPAFGFPEQVPSNIIKARCTEMRKLGASKKADFYQKAAGTEVDILIEDKRDENSGMLKGISSNYLSVLIKGEDSIRNRIVKVHINKVSGSYATGQTEDGKK